MTNNILERLRISHLGHRGDGVAEGDSGPIFVAQALPGELVEVARIGNDRARLISVIEASAERQAEPNPAECGGCGLRHMSVPMQLAWKRDLVIEQLRFAHVDVDVASCIDAHGDGRRRATFHARRGADGKLRVGFAMARSHDIVDLREHDCPILIPALKDAVAPVRAMAEILTPLKKPLDAVCTMTLTGLDVDLRGAGKVPEKLRLALVETAQKHRLARLSLHGDVLIEAQAPIVRFGLAEVAIPPGGFLQATEAGEAALAGLGMDATVGAKRIADLFAGSGTFALRLAEHAAVKAVENDRAAIAALDRAARRTQGLKKVEVEARDLFHRPLGPAELKGFDAVVFDPPRVGAEAQARALAESKVDRVVAVSCNPATLGRDLKILMDGGFSIESVTPVDQFRHSAHVEAVAVLRR